MSKDLNNYKGTVLESEFKMMLDSMTDQDAMRVMVMIQQAKDEIFDQWIEENGTPHADELLDRIK